MIIVKLFISATGNVFSRFQYHIYHIFIFSEKCDIGAKSNSIILIIQQIPVLINKWTIMGKCAQMMGKWFAYVLIENHPDSAG